MVQRIERLKSVGERENIDVFIFTSASSLKCFSGYYYNFETGPSPFQLLPAALVVVPDQFMGIVIADNESLTAPVPGIEVSVRKYASYVYEEPLDFTNHFLIQLHEMLKQIGMSKARIGIEQNTFPYVIANSLKAKYSEMEFVNITGEVSRIKAVKDADEIKNIRKATALSDIGQSAVIKYAQAGMTELELFSLVRLEIEASVGTRIPIMVDLVSGARTASGGGIPTNKTIQEGDLILSDLTPCFNGYWGDSCNTKVIGKPTSGQMKTFESVKQALNHAISAVRPGIKASEIDDLMRKHAGNFPHHGGHGVGTLYHEEPRIVRYNNTVVEPNMVIALEPAIYEKGFGIRLEHMVLVTETGCEVLTQFQHCF
ncbi:Xaa-Pro dipeptidase [Aquipluma nitroreducens]|uniref:Xaa-Pro dipeptidase n=1 Tax=Aquipluma nitroreducens TaxID=2010828 RepID=A0A5K7S3P0_9BACT|nr:Xaa-Pro peptidase family protein [Aquipluma nitroreducens]BBE16163.1 Xaa-Pro dipeptidase [Aquipluma nitroreducens]